MKEKNNFIVVDGCGRLSVEPDAAVVEATVTVMDLSYGAANTEVTRAIRRLREAGATLGFARADFRTTEFGVTREVQSSDDLRRARFLGFRAWHTVKLQMPLDKERVSQLVEVCQGSDADAEIQIRFIVTEPEIMRTRLLAASVENARQRAQILAQAAGVKLGEIVNIHYGAAAGRARSEPILPKDGGLTGIEFEVSAFVVEEHVQITWKIEDGGAADTADGS